MNMKLLSPAGDYECLKSAVFAGANEVYLGVKDYNARNIEGFNLDTLKQAINFAHAFGVRVFLTVNILFTDSEMQSALDLIVDSYNLGVDAFIIQDIGLASLVHKYYPEITMHASTQMAVHNLEGVRVLERLGFKRVVLSRETPISEIKRIHNNSCIEIEYFVQGALCVCFSGNCYMSSYLENASGNRGKCKQLCRLPYTLEHNDREIKSGYLLSAKDISLDEHLEELANAGVMSLKIEGRARRAYYVFTATKYYRDLLDGLSPNKQDLMLAFNRGFTAGYLNGNGDIISNIQGHNGIFVGKVTKVNNGKRFNLVNINTDYPISPKSTLKILRNGEEFTTIAPFDIKHNKHTATLTTTAKLQVYDEVYLLADFDKENNLKDIVKKAPINIDIQAKIGLPITATLSMLDNTITITGDIVDEAKNSPLSEKDFMTCFMKHDYFSPNINVDMNNIFIPKAKLNEFRRRCYETLENINIRELMKTKISTQYTVDPLEDFEISEDGVLGNANVQIYSPSEYNLNDIMRFKTECENKHKRPYLDLPNVAFTEDINILRDIISKTNISIVANNLYALTLSDNVIAGGGLNIYNSYTAEFFNLPCLIAEDNELLSNHKMPYMTMLHCPMKQFNSSQCTNCNYRDGYTYRMPNGKRFRLKRKKISTCIFYLTD